MYMARKNTKKNDTLAGARGRERAEYFANGGSTRNWRGNVATLDKKGRNRHKARTKARGRSVKEW